MKKNTIMKIKKHMLKVINKFSYKQYLDFRRNSMVAAGHFYSPIVSIDSIRKREVDIWSKANIEGLPGIDLQTDEQLKLIDCFSDFYKEMPFKPTKQADTRYYFENEYYSYSDGIILYSMIRYFQPKKIIEIGSGFSSALMLDTNELFFDNQINLTFIEPNPGRLLSVMRHNDKSSSRIIQSDVQQVELENFKQLGPGDILFVDSTHVVKTGSDVNCIIFDILPLLKSGVLIHFHDVFYPFEYPKRWVFQGRSWNENYFLRAFLMDNDKYEIKLFVDYLHLHYKKAFENLPLAYNNTGGNLWLLKK